MHELSLMEGIIQRAAAALAPYAAVKVNSLTVKTGVLANIMPAAFAFAFEALSAGTVFAGARLITETLPIAARCRDCGREFTRGKLPLVCPGCGKSEAEIVGGDEVYLVSLDFDEEGEAVAD
jgi:hydrogenase nickel incorporation protein HypA/HybF